MTDYKSVSEIATECGMSGRTIRALCQNGKIPGATKVGNVWVIPYDAMRPPDGRERNGKYKNWRKKENSK